jgi:hypothetical protein
VTGYNETYTATDLSAISIDGVAAIGAVFASLATLIGLILLWGFFKKHM